MDDQSATKSNAVTGTAWFSVVAWSGAEIKTELHLELSFTKGKRS